MAEYSLMLIKSVSLKQTISHLDWVNPEERHVVATIEGEANNVEAHKVKVETNNTEKQTREADKAKKTLNLFRL